MGNTCGCGKDAEDIKHEIAVDYQLDEESKVCTLTSLLLPCNFSSMKTSLILIC